MHELIKLNDVSISCHTNSYQQNVLLSQLNVTIYKGQWTILHGPSGSGKTTLLNVLAGQGEGLLSSGSVNLYYERQSMAYMPQQPCLLEGVSIADNIQMLRRLRGLNTDHDLTQLLLDVQFTQSLHQGIQNLSGGERMKIALLRALLMEPSILFLDEPSCHWDKITTQCIMSMLSKLQKKNQTTIVMVTHDLDLMVYAQSTIDVRMYQPTFTNVNIPINTVS